jgi:hypothetical protein
MIDAVDGYLKVVDDWGKALDNHSKDVSTGTCLKIDIIRKEIHA